MSKRHKLAGSIVVVILLAQAFTLAQTQGGQLTNDETASLIARAATGMADPDSVIAALAKSDGRLVSALRDVLFEVRLSHETSITGTKGSARETFYPMPTHRVAIKVLEAVGSAGSYAVILDAALEHQDPQVRGICLSSLACAFQARARSGRFRPDKELIHLYLSRAADTLMIRELGMRVGDVARLGLKNWTAKGGTRPVSGTLRLKEPPRESGYRPYWERWWATRSGKIKWDEANGLFVLPN